MTTRRPRGTGSLFQRADGRWIARIDAGFTPHGTRRRVTFSSMDRDACQAKLDAYLAEHLPNRPGQRRGQRRDHLAHARTLATHTPGEWYAKVDAAQGACHHCGRPVGVGGCKDHLTPISRGGSDGIDNVVLSCWDCNAAKSDMTEAEFQAWAADEGFFDQPQRLTLPTAKGNRRITREMAAVMQIPRAERGALLNSGRLMARVAEEMKRLDG